MKSKAKDEKGLKDVYYLKNILSFTTSIHVRTVYECKYSFILIEYLHHLQSEWFLSSDLLRT